MRLDYTDTDKLIAYVDHVAACERHGNIADCDACAAAYGDAKAVIDAARDRAITAKAAIVEVTLGGDDRKPRKCIGCQIAKTVIRCPVCHMPVCRPCLENGANHSHRVRFKDTVEEFVQVAKYGYWTQDGKDVRKIIHAAQLHGKPCVWQEVRIKTGQMRKGWNGQVYEEERWDGYRNTVTGEHIHNMSIKVCGTRRRLWKKKPIVRGETYDVIAEDYNPDLHDLLS